MIVLGLEVFIKTALVGLTKNTTSLTGQRCREL